MRRTSQMAPVVRQLYAPDPDPGRVEAALALWRQALARRLAGAPAPAPARPQPLSGTSAPTR